MAEAREAEQPKEYVWTAQKPLHRGPGREIHRGERLTPSAAMLAAFGDLMVPAGQDLLLPGPGTPVHVGGSDLAPEVLAHRMAEQQGTTSSTAGYPPPEPELERSSTAQAKRVTVPEPAQPKRPTKE